MFESVRVFRRGIGEQSEVVGKEMYEFEDRGGRMLALRPEGTASLVRTYVQHRPNLPWKAWYVTPAFRYERPQAGRYRQHHQLGVEALGPSDPDLDVEVVVLAHDFYRAIGLGEIALRLNSMGDAHCRPAYLDTLRTAFSAKRDQLCPEHRERPDANPLRVFDCKTPECLAATADAPVLADHLCDECRDHLARVRSGLEAAGVHYVMDDRLVRGLDYYTRTTFEFASGALEASPKRGRGWWPLRRAGRGARWTAHPRRRLRHRHRACAAGLRRRGRPARSGPGSRRMGRRRGRRRRGA